MTKKEQIENYMKNLGISEEEALQLWEDDKEDFIGEEGEKMQENAKKIKNYTQAKPTKERKPREKKEDAEKARLIKIIAEGLLQCDINAVITNSTKCIDFEIDGVGFTVNLVRHRPSK